ncbi:MAG: YfiH family protein [Sulfurimonas sp.]|jgi:YfiH family protein|uniref:peptidoglycan editing factor PgeF n=1 Tax=Sulfurimonas sp. TaxID=2022749 RepID=UPI0039E4FEC9
MNIIQSTSLRKFINLTSGFTTREIGNLAFHVNDTISNVTKNHEKLAHELDYKKDSLLHMKQIHSADVRIVNADDNFTNPQSCDALVTNKRNTPLMVMVADCSPILFYDDTTQVIAVAHAGRQGAFKNIVQNTIDAMCLNFYASQKNIHVSIGASIGVCCYEVGEEIYKEAKQLNLEDSLQIRGNHYYLNVSYILKKQLLDAGIQEEHIEVSNECTCCLKEKYYSYRAKANTGRFAGVIMLK